MTRPADTPCASCGAPSLVTVNGRGGCRDHIDQAFAVVDAMAAALRELAEGKGRSASVFMSAELGQ